VGPLIYTSIFLATKAKFKEFGFYPSGKGRQTVTQAIYIIYHKFTQSFFTYLNEDLISLFIEGMSYLLMKV